MTRRGKSLHQAAAELKLSKSTACRYQKSFLNKFSEPIHGGRPSLTSE
jgi:transposase